MAISAGTKPEILYTKSVENLLPEIQNIWMRRSEFMSFISDSQIEAGSSPVTEWEINTHSAGRVQAINTGAETLGAVNLATAVRASTRPQKLLYRYAIPCTMLDLAARGTESQMEQIVEDFAVGGAYTFRRKFFERFLTGVVRTETDAGDTGEFAGIATLNGTLNYTPDGQTYPGWLVAAAPSAQTGTAFGVNRAGAASNPTPNWANQYAAVVSVTSDGFRKFQVMQRAMMRIRPEQAMEADVALADDLSYANFIDVHQDSVVRVDKINDFYIGSGHMEAFKVGPTALISEDILGVDGDFAGSFVTTNNGLIVILTMKDVKLLVYGNSAHNDKQAYFTQNPAVKSQATDQYLHEFAFHGNLYTRHLGRHGLLANTWVK